MLSRIEPNEYREIKDAHHELISQHPLINAVVSNVQEGFVYADPSRNSFLVSTKSGFSLFNAPEKTAAFNQEFFDYLRTNRELSDYLHVYRPEASFRSYIESVWDKHRIRRRAQFRRYDTHMATDHEHLLPPGYQITTIQEMDFDQLEEAFHLDFAHRYWNSRAEFLNNAIGACILNESSKPAAICYSACVVDAIAEMDTLVLPEYRGKRFMRIVSEPFFNLATVNKLVPHWDTFISNSASYIMAQKFELSPVQEYDLLSLVLR